MTTLPSTTPAGDGHLDLHRVRDGLAIAETVRGHLDSSTDEIQIDRLVLRGSCTINVLDLEAVFDLGAQGHIAEFRVEEGSWSLRARVDGLAQPSIDADGDPQTVLTAAEIAALNRAIAASNAVGALRVVERLQCSVRIVISNDPAQSGTHWIRGTADLDGLLSGVRWHATAAALGTGPPTLVVSDAGADRIATSGLVVCGPDAVPPTQAMPVVDDVAYRKLQGRDGRPHLPSPAMFGWTDTANAPTGGLATLAGGFNGIARRLSWYWMAADTRISDSGQVEVTYSGARTISFALAPVPVPDVQADLALYEWAAAGNDPARQEALQHAASLAVSSAADLGSGAVPALRTARSLYELSRRTAISEALTASRSAREATLNAARQAADTARQSAGKTVERALLQVAAAVAIVLSNATNLLGRGPAFFLLLLVAALSVTSLVVALRVELPSADQALTAELQDLDQYRDVLASDDITAVRGIHTVATARADLRRARKATASVYIGSAAAVLLIGGLLVAHHHAHEATAPKPTPSATSTTSPPPPLGSSNPAPALGS